MLENKARILDLCAYTRGTQELPRQGSMQVQGPVDDNPKRQATG